jgi:hypothetical protein
MIKLRSFVFVSLGQGRIQTELKKVSLDPMPCRIYSPNNTPVLDIEL